MTIRKAFDYLILGTVFTTTTVMVFGLYIAGTMGYERATSKVELQTARNMIKVGLVMQLVSVGTAYELGKLKNKGE